MNVARDDPDPAGVDSASATAARAAPTSSSGRARETTLTCSGSIRLGAPGQPNIATGSGVPTSTTCSTPSRSARDLLWEIREAFDAGRARATLHAGGERLNEEAAAGRAGDARSGLEGTASTRGTAHKQRARLPAAQRVDARPLRATIRGREEPMASRSVRHRSLARFADPPERSTSPPGRAGRIAARTAVATSAPILCASVLVRTQSETGAASASMSLFSGESNCEVPGRVVAHHVDDGRVGTTGVVEIGQSVGEAWSQVEQRHRRTPRHAAEPVGRTGADTFEEAEHGTNPRDSIQGNDERHLGRARVGEAHVDARVARGAHQAFGTVHDLPVLVDVSRSSRASAVSARRSRSKSPRISVCSGSMWFATKAPSATQRTSRANSPANRSALSGSKRIEQGCQEHADAIERQFTNPADDRERRFVDFAALERDEQEEAQELGLLLE